MIKISNLTKKIGEKTILSNFNMEVNLGEMVMIDGKSGSGKTTILKIISGLDKKYTGEVEINGTNLQKLSESELSKFRRQNIGFVFQFFNLYENSSVYDNIIFLSKFYNFGKNSKNKADELMKKLGIFELKNKKISNLSGGELQRVAIARALFNQTKILLLDEPTSHLDKENIDNFFEILIDIKKEFDLTIICVAHDDFTKKYFSKVINIC